MKSLINDIVETFKLGHEYRISSSHLPHCYMVEIRVVYLGGKRPLYAIASVVPELSTHKGHLCTIIKQLIANIEEVVARPKKFFRGMDHITRHIGGHPLEHMLSF